MAPSEPMPRYDLEAPAPVDDRVAGALGQAGEEAADHHAVGPGGEGLGDVARVADAAVGDDRDAAGGRLGRLVDGGDLGHADPRDDPRRADRARPDPHLDGVGPRVDQGAGPLGGRDVAGDDLDVVVPLDPAHRLDDVLAVPVRRVDDQHVDVGLQQRGDPLEVVHARPPRRRGAVPGRPCRRWDTGAACRCP